MDIERTILITGAGRGLGRAMAAHLAAPGTLLLLHHSASAQGAEDTLAMVEEKGGAGALLPADFADPDARKKLIAAVKNHTDHLNCVIHNAGIFDEKPLLEITPEHWNKVMEVNLNAVFELTTGLLPLIRASGHGRFIAIGDSGADRVIARNKSTAYHVSKLGLSVLVRSFASTLGGEGIGFNQISPGYLENSVGKPEKPIPAGRAGRFADVLGALDYLLSPQADYVNGANIVVSGGWNL